jgi:hypothetical protein
METFGSLKDSQSHLTIRKTTNVVLWSSVHLNFVSTGQDSIYLSLENSSVYSYRDTEPYSQRLPIDYGPSSPSVLVPSVYQTTLLTAVGVPGPLVHSSVVNIVTLYLGSKLNAGHITSTRILNTGSDC